MRQPLTAFVNAASLKVTGRQNINLDPDEVRVTEKGNPATEGDYTLWLGAAFHHHGDGAYQQPG